MLKLIVFVSGMTVMAAEMAASRLLAPYFGTSLFVWTNLIGIVMLALTAGYYVGGRLADNKPRKNTLGLIGLAGGTYIALLPFLVRPIMAVSLLAINNTSVSMFYGSLIASILLISTPMFLLGMVSPMAIRLQSKSVKNVGKTAGGIYALGTAGSIVGTFLPALFTIPFVGTQKTFLLFGSILVLSAVPMLVRKKLALFALLLIPLWMISPAIKTEEGLILERESLYNYIQVIDNQGTLSLKLNEGNAVHSVYHPASYITGNVWDYFSVLPLEQETENALIIGLACGTISRTYSKFYPEIHVDGVEIDPEIVRVGKEMFDLDQPNLDIHETDGRTYLQYTDTMYDIIIVDAYKQPYIPFHLTTREFFQIAHEHLDKGILGINVGATGEDSAVHKMIRNTMASVFEYVYDVQVPGTFNYVMIGSDRELFTAKSVNAPDVTLGKLWRYMKYSKNLDEYNPSEIVLTDDKAPVEMLTDLMILDFALEQP